MKDKFLANGDLATLDASVRKLVKEGVNVEIIKQRAIKAGWSRPGISKALIAAGVRQRAVRSDMGTGSGPMPETIANLILDAYQERERALIFLGRFGESFPGPNWKIPEIPEASNPHYHRPSAEGLKKQILAVSQREEKVTDHTIMLMELNPPSQNY